MPEIDLPLDALLPDPRNARRHSPRNLALIADALRDVGAARSIVVDETGTVLAGNATLAAAGQAGLVRVRIVDADGTELIAVRRTGLTADQKQRLALYDNRAAELAEWDTAVLASLADEVDLTALWDADDLAGLLEDDAVPLSHHGDPDDVPDLPEAPVTQLGDLWRLGSHRLLCGDATSQGDIRLLMDGHHADMAWCDPPLGIDLHHQRQRTGPIANDRNADARQVWAAFLPHVWSILKPDSVAFLCQGWSEFDWTLPLVRQYFQIKSKIVWHKTQWGIGYYLRPQHEDILYCWKGTPPKPREAISDVWTHARPSAPVHAAEKPVDLSQTAVTFASPPAGLVVDLFAGVGNIVIACTRTGRRCHMMELEPRYCDVIVRRWEAFTDETAERISTSIAA